MHGQFIVQCPEDDIQLTQPRTAEPSSVEMRVAGYKGGRISRRRKADLTKDKENNNE